MPEEKETDVKQVPVEASTTEAKPEVAVSPAESTSVQPKEETPSHIPYLRFKEVNEKRKSLETELSDLRRRLADREKASEQNDPEQMENETMSKAVKKLVQNGMNPQAAQVFAEVFKDMAKKEGRKFRSELGSFQEKLEEKNAEKELSARQAEFRKAHNDYAEYEDAMTKRWEGLDEGSQRALLASPKAYEFLYASAKADKLEEVAAKGREEGRKEAYEGKSLKAAVSSTPGTTAQPRKKYTAEDVSKLSLKEYKANRDQILEDVYGAKK